MTLAKIDPHAVLRGLLSLEETFRISVQKLDAAKTKLAQSSKESVEAYDLAKKEVEECEASALIQKTNLRDWESHYLGYTTEERDAGKLPSPSALLRVLRLGFLLTEDETENKPAQHNFGN